MDHLSFEGKPCPIAAEMFTKEVKKIFDTIGIPIEYRISFASFIFKKVTSHWWDIIGNSYHTFSMMCNQFDYLFQETYANVEHQIAMIKVYEHLVQKIWLLLSTRKGSLS